MQVWIRWVLEFQDDDFGPPEIEGIYGYDPGEDTGLTPPHSYWTRYVVDGPFDVKNGGINEHYRSDGWDHKVRMEPKRYTNGTLKCGISCAILGE